MREFILLVLAFSPAFSKVEFEKDEGLVILTGDNFDEAVKEFKHLLVYFYAPWCGHCKALGPELVKANQQLIENDSEIRIGQVNGVDEKELLERFGVTGYPKLFFYRNHESIPYTGRRMAPEIIEWLEFKITQQVKLLDTSDAVNAFLEENEVAVVGYFEEATPEQRGYEKACIDYDDYGVHYPIGLTANAEVIANIGLTNGIMLHAKFEEKPIKYSGDFTTQNIRDFITVNALPGVTEMNHDNAQKLFKSPNDGKSHLLVFHNKSTDTFEDEFKMLNRVGKQFKEKVLFVSVDVSENDHRRMVEFLGVRHRINNDTFPSMRIVQLPGTSAAPVRYKPDDTTVSEENINKFVTEYIEGKVAREYFREALPADWDAKDVKLLTGVNFDEFVSEKGANILVMFYAPWCGHCKNLYPVWDTLADKYKSSGLKVGKIDSTMNEIKGMDNINSFPTIRLYKKDGTQSEYNGERTVEGIAKFIETDGIYGMAAPDHDEL